MNKISFLMLDNEDEIIDAKIDGEWTKDTVSFIYEEFNYIIKLEPFSFTKYNKEYKIEITKDNILINMIEIFKMPIEMNYLKLEKDYIEFEYTGVEDGVIKKIKIMNINC